MTNYIAGLNLDVLDMSSIHSVFICHPIFGVMSKMWQCSDCGNWHPWWSGIDGLDFDEGAFRGVAPANNDPFTKEWFFALFEDVAVTIPIPETRLIAFHVLTKVGAEQIHDITKWPEIFFPPLKVETWRVISYLVYNGYGAQDLLSPKPESNPEGHNHEQKEAVVLQFDSSRKPRK